LGFETVCGVLVQLIIEKGEVGLVFTAELELDGQKLLF
jgi:hypothetical protein